ncbi:hypothetical protein [Limnovirga soli]|uniref:Uncharacterized protein n=1 Tax=Limnovirga soli TaxID=2656915 RepID=A0A8J8JSX4_9BACT|nr:hypothetical protein [Limnovirga soli]NNV54545.1 hypothetical protein [Limnovirga soli]
MKKIMIFFLFCMFSCKPSAEDLQNELKAKAEPVVKKYIKSLMDSTNTIDSFLIDKIDTLHSNYLCTLKSLNYLDDGVADSAELEKAIGEFRYYKRLNEISYNQTIADLAEEKRLEGLKVLAHKNYNDSMGILLYEKSLHADSTDFLMYVVRFHCKYSDKNNVQKAIDTGEIFLTKDFKIRERQDLLEE